MHVKVMVLAGNQNDCFFKIQKLHQSYRVPTQVYKRNEQANKKSCFPPTFKTQLPRPKFKKQVEF